eukprot:s2510_g7.t1
MDAACSIERSLQKTCIDRALTAMGGQLTGPCHQSPRPCGSPPKLRNWKGGEAEASTDWRHLALLRSGRRHHCLPSLRSCDSDWRGWREPREPLFREPSTPRILIESDRPARAATPPATAPALSSDVGLSLSLSLGESRRDFRPATSERASLRLVEQTKIDDPDKFKIWDVGGRANTPISFWREERQYEAAAEQAFGTSSTPWSNLSHKKVRAMQEKGHMRALLLGPSQGSTPGPETPRDLNGLWISTDGELRGEVEGDVLRWDCDGSRSRLRLTGERQEIVSLAVDGCRHFGALSEDGRRLLWADGDVWVRHDQEAQALAKVVRDQCGGGWQPAQPQPPNDCEPSDAAPPVGWSKWKLRWRPNSDGLHTLSDPSSACPFRFSFATDRLQRLNRFCALRTWKPVPRMAGTVGRVALILKVHAPGQTATLCSPPEGVASFRWMQKLFALLQPLEGNVFGCCLLGSLPEVSSHLWQHQALWLRLQMQPVRESEESEHISVQFSELVDPLADSSRCRYVYASAFCMHEEDFNHHVGRVVTLPTANGRVGVSLHGAVWEEPEKAAATHRPRRKYDPFSLDPQNLRRVMPPSTGRMCILDSMGPTGIKRLLGESGWGLPDNVVELVVSQLEIRSVQSDEVRVTNCSSGRHDFDISVVLNEREDEWRISFVAMKIPPLPHGPLSVRDFHLLAGGSSEDPESWECWIERICRDPTAALSRFYRLHRPLPSVLRIGCCREGSLTQLSPRVPEEKLTQIHAATQANEVLLEDEQMLPRRKGTGAAACVAL